jgi:hypothetical protein
MMRKLAWGLGALILLPAVGAALMRANGIIIPGLGTPDLPPAFAQAAAAGDSLALAGKAFNRCRFLRDTAKSDCYEEILLTLVKERRIRLAMGTLARIGELDGDVRRHGHDYSHVIGINAWRPGQDIGEAYEQCTELFQSGCYHGVIQVYLTAQGISDTTVPELCNSIPSARDVLFLRFQCVHGLGHGMVMLHQAHLPKALAGCDLLLSAWDRDSCYGGAFMEFILTGRGQSHGEHAAHVAAELAAADTSGGRGQAAHDTADEHAGHDMPADTFAIRRPGDLLYPCNVLGDKYQRACYAMQAGIMVESVGLDFRRIAEGCDRAPEPWLPTCYQGIGTYVSGTTVRDPAAAVKECGLGRVEYQPWCYIGVVKNFIDVTARPEDGLEFCGMAELPANRAACYVAIGEQVSVLRSWNLEREEFCTTVPAEAKAACRFGAGLTDEPPPGLQRPEWFRRGVD